MEIMMIHSRGRGFTGTPCICDSTDSWWWHNNNTIGSKQGLSVAGGKRGQSLGM